MKIEASGTALLSIRPTISATSSCVRSTAKEGISNAPPACLAALNLRCEKLGPFAVRNVEAVPVTIGRLADDDIERRRRIRVGLQQFVIGS